MQQPIPKLPSIDDAKQAGPIPLDADVLHQIAGGIAQPTSPSVVVIIGPEW